MPCSSSPSNEAASATASKVKKPVRVVREARVAVLPTCDKVAAAPISDALAEEEAQEVEEAMVDAMMAMGEEELQSRPVNPAIGSRPNKRKTTAAAPPSLDQLYKCAAYSTEQFGMAPTTRKSYAGHIRGFKSFAVSTALVEPNFAQVLRERSADTAVLVTRYITYKGLTTGFGTISALRSALTYYFEESFECSVSRIPGHDVNATDSVLCRGRRRNTSRTTTLLAIR